MISLSIRVGWTSNRVLIWWNNGCMTFWLITQNQRDCFSFLVLAVVLLLFFFFFCFSSSSSLQSGSWFNILEQLVFKYIVVILFCTSLRLKFCTMIVKSILNCAVNTYFSWCTMQNAACSFCLRCSLNILSGISPSSPHRKAGKHQLNSCLPAYHHMRAAVRELVSSPGSKPSRQISNTKWDDILPSSRQR